MSCNACREKGISHENKLAKHQNHLTSILFTNSHAKPALIPYKSFSTSEVRPNVLHIWLDSYKLLLKWMFKFVELNHNFFETEKSLKSPKHYETPAKLKSFISLNWLGSVITVLTCAVEQPWYRVCLKICIYKNIYEQKKNFK